MSVATATRAWIRGVAYVRNPGVTDVCSTVFLRVAPRCCGIQKSAWNPAQSDPSPPLPFSEKLRNLDANLSDELLSRSLAPSRAAEELAGSPDGGDGSDTQKRFADLRESYARELAARGPSVAAAAKEREADAEVGLQSEAEGEAGASHAAGSAGGERGEALRQHEKQPKVKRKVLRSEWLEMGEMPPPRQEALDRDDEAGLARNRNMVFLYLRRHLGDHDAQAAVGKLESSLHKLDIHAMQNVFRALTELIGPAGARTVIKRTPVVLGYDSPSLRSAFGALQQKLGRAKARRAVEVHPALLGAHGGRFIKVNTDLLSELLGSEERGRLAILANPAVLKADPKRIRDSHVAFKQCVGVIPGNRLLAAHPGILAHPAATIRSSFTALLDLLGEQAALEVVQRAPLVLSCGADQIRKASLALQKVLAGGRALQAIRVSPLLLQAPPPTLEAAVPLLMTDLGEAAFVQAIASSPGLFRAKPHTMAAVLPCLEEVCGGDREAARGLLRRYPGLYTGKQAAMRALHRTLEALVGPADVLRVIEACPGLLRADPGDVQAAIGALRGVLGEETAVRAARVSPALLLLPPSSIGEALPALIEKLGVESAVRAAGLHRGLMERRPQQLWDSWRCYRTLQGKLKLPPEPPIKSLLQRYPAALAVEWQDVQMYAPVLAGLLGLEAAVQALHSSPCLLNAGPEQTCAVLGVLADLFGVEPALQAVEACPDVLLGRPDYMKETHSMLCSLLGIEVTMSVLRHDYHVLCLSPVTIGKRYKAMLDILGESESVRQVLATQPSLFSHPQSFIGRFLTPVATRAAKGKYGKRPGDKRQTGSSFWGDKKSRKRGSREQ